MLDFTFNDCKHKTVFIKILQEDDCDATEFIKINSETDYQILENIIKEYSEEEILNEYFIYE